MKWWTLSVCLLYINYINIQCLHLLLWFVVFILQLQAQQTEKSIQQEFQELHDFLRKEEEARLDAFRTEKAQKTDEINTTLTNLNTKISSLEERVQTINQELKAKDHSFMLVHVFGVPYQAGEVIIIWNIIFIDNSSGLRHFEILWFGIITIWIYGNRKTIPG